MYSHTKCTTEECIAYRMDWTAYSPIHENDPQSPQDPALSTYNCEIPWCHKLSVDGYDKVVDTILDGEVALIRVSTTLDNKKIIQLTASRHSRSPTKHLQQITTKLHFASTSNTPFAQHNGWTARTPYVAISHVWSDGLGDPNDNFLPACRLVRLEEMVNELYPGSTLKAERKQIQLGDSTCLYTTIQGRVSPKSRLKNETERIIQGRLRGESDIVKAAWIRPILHLWPLTYLVSDVNRRHGRGMDLRHLSWCLKDRHTSNRFDEPLCLAILLQPSLLPQFDNENQQNRMMLLFNSFKEINHEVLWWPVQRYENEGHR